MAPQAATPSAAGSTVDPAPQPWSSHSRRSEKGRPPAGGRFAGRKLLFVVNEAYFLVSHRLPVALAAQQAGFEIHVAAPDDHVWAPDGFSTAHLARLGFTYHAIPLSRRGTKPLQELQTVLAICRLYRSLRPDLVHLLTIKPVLYGGIAARMLGVPAQVAAVTGLGQVFVAKGRRAAALRGLVRGVYRLATGHANSRVIVQNPEDRALLVKSRAVPADRVELIRGSGVPLNEYRFTPDPGGQPVIILPARLIWEKGVAQFVGAARRLKQANVQARCVLVGATHPANPRSVPQAQLEAWVREGAVEWWGRRDDMPAVLQQTHVTCLPSIYGEGVPRALIEAAACGRPIVATDIPGCREVVRNGENGLLVPPGDEVALAAALRQLVGDPELRVRMGSRGREIAAEEFAAEEVAERTLAIYDALLRRT